MLTFQEFVKRIQSKSISGNARVLAFVGPEQFLRNRGIKFIRSINADLTEETKLFQPITFDHKAFLNELYSVPFLQQRKLIVLDLGQISSQSNGLTNQSSIEASLEEYFLMPSLFSILVITTDNWCLRPKLKDLIIKNDGLLVECTKIPDYQLIRWVITEIQAYGKTITLPTARFLIEQTGNDLTKIDETIQKSVLFVGKQRQIGREAMQQLVAEDREYDKKTLVKAILSHQAYKALEMLNRFVAEDNETYQIIGYLAGVFKRESLPLKMRHKKIKLLLETDIAIKTGLMPEDRALQLLVVKLAGNK